jgi:hypothetical protein
MATTIEVVRDEITLSRVLGTPKVPLSEGQARLCVESFALTSNNITYAAFGDGLRYWDFFPAESSGSAADGRNWGRVPVWGFAKVVESRSTDLEVGRRVYGYLPMSDELVVQPGRRDDSGFTDVAEHRRPMAAAYNRYVFPEVAPAYDPAFDAHQMVLWPLFMTSFMIDDYLGSEGTDRPEMFGASIVVLSSASSKTAIGAAHLLARRHGLRVVGLTSERSLEFVEGLGCYHDVLSYASVGDCPLGDAVYVDIAGDRSVNHGVHSRYDSRLAHSLVVGGTHWNAEPPPAAPLPGPKPEFFFAPAQIALRTKQWGREGLDERVGSSWRRFAEWSNEWLRFETTTGADGIRSLYDQLAAGRVDPRVGHVCSMTAG